MGTTSTTTFQCHWKVWTCGKGEKKHFVGASLHVLFLKSTNEKWHSLKTVFALTHLPEAWDKLKYNWIRTSENYERICLNKQKIFLNLAFGQVGEKNEGKDCKDGNTHYCQRSDFL